MSEALGIRARLKEQSYRDPDLSEQWLREADWRARNEFRGDAAKIIQRLTQEVREYRDKEK